MCVLRILEEPRPLTSEVLLAHDQDPDVHPLHRGVLFCQRQGRQPGLLRRLCGQSEFVTCEAHSVYILLLMQWN